MLAVLLSIGSLGWQAPAQPLPTVPTTLTIRLGHPDQQLARFLKLFDGAKAPDPPTAYARWKRAHPTAAPTKTFEAIFALLNPEMVRELKTLDEATFVIRSLPEGGVTWFGALPGDDGTFEAVATALALTDGQSVEPLEGQPVDRLGPPGAPFMSRGPDGRGAILARSRLELLQARVFSSGAVDDSRSQPDGIYAILKPGASSPSAPVSLRQGLEALNAAGCDRVDVLSNLEAETLRLTFKGEYAAPPALAGLKLDPALLLPIADEDVTLATALAIDPSPQGWNRLFAWADRVEKADPARAQLAPLRVRLALFAAGVRFNLEADLLPYLQTVSAYVLRDGKDPMGQVIVGLHLNDAKRASSFVSTVLPRVSKAAGQGDAFVAKDGTTRWPKGSGAFGGVEARADGKSVWIGWSRAGLVEGQPGPLAALGRNPGARRPWSAGVFDPARPPQRLVVFKPNAVNALVAPDSRVTWVGHLDATSSNDAIRWTGLRGVVHGVVEHFLDEPRDPAR